MEKAILLAAAACCCTAAASVCQRMGAKNSQTSLIAAGAATMLLASHALAAGPLAAAQPGFTILDPLSASLLGVFLFGEHIRTGAADLAGEALALGVVIGAAVTLSRSCHLAGENSHPSRLVEPAAVRA